MTVPPEVKTDWSACRSSFSADWRAAGEALAAERLARKGDLYFIRAGHAVKIGHTTNIAKRLLKMQVDNHEPVDCLVLLRGCGHEERRWHEMFAADRIRGEWFKWTPALQAEVERLRAEICGCSAPVL